MCSAGRPSGRPAGVRRLGAVDTTAAVPEPPAASASFSGRGSSSDPDALSEAHPGPAASSDPDALSGENPTSGPDPGATSRSLPGSGFGLPSDAVAPVEGIGVLHLFCHVGPAADRRGLVAAVTDARAAGDQVVCASVLGHKADMAFMALGSDLRRLRALQGRLQAAGCQLAGSYVSLTEVSEYAAGIPDDMRQARLYPVLPPEGKPAFCFYPMSKRRSDAHNWYSLGFEERKELMIGHGRVGRRYHGRVLQLVTGSTGLDDWEWGVTLFAARPDDLKACVYEMRFDPASAHFAEFGPFWSGIVGDVTDVLDLAGIGA